MNNKAEKQIGIGIYGLGWVGEQHLEAFLADSRCHVRGVCVRNLDKAAQTLRRYGCECPVHAKFEALLQDKTVEAISICTPHDLHAQETIQAARAGKHVLIEKPMCLRPQEMAEMAQAVSDASVRSLVSFVARWNPAVQMIKGWLKQGLIGEIFHAEVDYLHGINPARKAYAIASREVGGSALLTAGLHAVDMLRFLLADEATEVAAMANCSSANDRGYEYPPNIEMLTRFGGGTVGKVSCSFEYRGPYQFNIRLLGDRGSIVDNRLFVQDWEGQSDFAEFPTVLPDSADVTHHPFPEQIAHFLDCIINKVESHANVEDACRTHELVFAADRAAERNEIVKLPLQIEQ